MKKVLVYKYGSVGTYNFTDIEEPDESIKMESDTKIEISEEKYKDFVRIRKEYYDMQKELEKISLHY